MKKKHWYYVLTAFALLLLLSPVFYYLSIRLGEDDSINAIPHGYTNDASQLNLTRMDTIIAVPRGKMEIQEQLRGILEFARKNHLKISIAGAKHSMGGHTMYPGGILLNMLPYKHMELDTISNVLTIGSGALWEDAIRFLDMYGRSVAVMQAFSSFSVGGTISVNGHGWQNDSPPVAISVLSFTLMTHDGSIVNCSRNENAGLFRLVIGGYGLFGVILDVKLRVVPNAALQFRYFRLSPENYLEYYKKYITGNSSVNLVFGRLRVSEKHFLEEATLNFFEAVNSEIPVLEGNKNTESRRIVFRGSVDSEFGKRLRWDLETGMNKVSASNVYSRNDLLNDHVSLIENRDTSSTDLLQEYFIPGRNFMQFIADIKPVLRKSQPDLLNITIRSVSEDRDSYLAYAREPVFGFVLLFNQKKTPEQEAEMKRLTNLLVDAALKNEGTFYLPYRLHIDKVKMRKSYPQAEEFFQLKLRYDPDEIFSNMFYLHYK